MSQDEELLELVRSLTDRIEGLEIKIKQLGLRTEDVPEEVMVAIAAAVATAPSVASRASARRAAGPRAPFARSTPTTRCTPAKEDQ